MKIKSFQIFGLLFCLGIVAFLVVLYQQFNAITHFIPDYPKLPLEEIITNLPISQDNYKLLYQQTGLSPKAINQILETSPMPLEEIINFQTLFFQEVITSCTTPNLVTKEDYIVDENGNPTKTSVIITPKKGDILIHFSAHTLGWRNGHSALVVDPIKMTTLEAIAPSINSSIQSIDKWRRYSNFILLRLKEPLASKASKAADFALTNLENLPYSLTIGVFTKDGKVTQDLTSTHCAHLVWKSFYSQGIDLDSNGGRLVTPQNIVASDYLEIIQIYGFNPNDYMPIFN